MFNSTEFITSQLAYLATSTVFDIGCGTDPQSRHIRFKNLFTSCRPHFMLFDINSNVFPHARVAIQQKLVDKNYHVSENMQDILAMDADDFRIGVEAYNTSLIAGPTIVCTEMAEHISPEKSWKLIENLTAAGGLIIFSAAPPYQGGEGHINCRPLSEWVLHFITNSYVVLDYRHHYWHTLEDRNVSVWSVQNTIAALPRRLYSKFEPLIMGAKKSPIVYRSAVDADSVRRIDVIHPKFIEAGIANGWFNTHS